MYIRCCPDEDGENYSIKSLGIDSKHRFAQLVPQELFLEFFVSFPYSFFLPLPPPISSPSPMTGKACLRS